MTHRSQIAGPVRVLGIVLAQRQKLWHESAQLLDHRPPLAIGIGPKHRRGRSHVAGVVSAGVGERLSYRFK